MILLLTGWVLVEGEQPLPSLSFLLPLGAIGGWGLMQVATGATVYRYASWIAAFRYLSLAATAFTSHQLFSRWARRRIESEAEERSPKQPYSLGSRRATPRKFATPTEFLALEMLWIDAFSCLGFVLAIVGVLAYFTSPSKVLWLIDAPYPDVWGPFLSRNNFAQFLELALPAALWQTLRRPDRQRYWWMAATMLAAGLASSSRAGALLLLAESAGFAFLYLRRNHGRRRTLAGFTAAAMGLSVLAGAETLFHRLGRDHPLAGRDQIYQGTLQLIASRPFEGYGVGTYASVYPEFATFDAGARVQHAHNDLLEFAAEGGLAFSAIWIWLLGRSSLLSLPTVWAWGIPAVFCHALVDFPLARHGIAAWVFLFLGALESARSNHRLQRRPT